MDISKGSACAGLEHCMPNKDDHGLLVGNALCVSLVDLFVQSQQTLKDREVITLALCGLLAYSHAAKATAVQLGLHQCSLNACVSLAAAVSAGVQKSRKRSAKLQFLKKQRKPSNSSTSHREALKDIKQHSAAQPSQYKAKMKAIPLRKPTISLTQPSPNIADNASELDSEEAAEEAAMLEDCADKSKEEIGPLCVSLHQGNLHGAVQSLLLLLKIQQALAFQDGKAR